MEMLSEIMRTEKSRWRAYVRDGASFRGHLILELVNLLVSPPFRTLIIMMVNATLYRKMYTIIVDLFRPLYELIYLLSLTIS